MPHDRRRLVLSLLAAVAAAATADAGDWPQFRGPGGRGVAVGAGPLPMNIGPSQSVLWKSPTPPGHSSPILVGDQIYLTGVKDKKLLTMALDRTTGARRWEASAPYATLEQIHSIGSHAQSTPVADADGVISFFGSAGLFAYDKQGKLVWKIPMGPFKNNFGAGSSPILVGDKVILCQDHDVESFLAAYDRKTGSPLWKTDRSEFPRNYCTPVLWTAGGRQEIVVAGTLEVRGYDLETGKEIWRVHGIARIVNTTPFVGPDGMLYVCAWSPGGDDADRIQAPPFDELIRSSDADKSGALEAKEPPEGPIKQRFDQIDRDKDGRITRAEYDAMRRVFDLARNVFLAIKPGGVGDVTASHVVWKQTRLLPYCPSPVLYEDHIFMVRTGGVFSSLDAKTGRTLKQGRVSGRADYFSSPAAGDGKVYVVSQRGELTVVSAEAQWRELHSAKFEEDVFASPAIVDGRIYFRTASKLYCFGQTQLAAATKRSP